MRGNATATVLMFNNVIELLLAIATVQYTGLANSPSGMVVATYTLMRSLLESHWNLAYLIADPSSRAKHCLSFVYCYNKVSLRQSIRAIKGYKLSPEAEASQIAQAETETAAILDQSHFADTASLYQVAEKWLGN